MYELFTKRATKAMELANEEAQRFNHEYIDTEHLLLGLMSEDTGVAATILKKLDVTLRKIRVEVEKIHESGPNMATLSKLPLAPRAKRVIEGALEEARNRHQDKVDTEHLLLSLLRNRDGIAARVLINCGLPSERILQEVENALRQPES